MKILPAIMALVIFAAISSNVFAGGSHQLRNQARLQRAWDKWQTKQTEMWKKFDAEMAAIEKQVQTAIPDTREETK